MRLLIEGTVHRFNPTESHLPTNRPTLCGVVANYGQWRVVMPGDQHPVCEECEARAVELKLGTLTPSEVWNEVADVLVKDGGWTRRSS